VESYLIALEIKSALLLLSLSPVVLDYVDAVECLRVMVDGDNDNNNSEETVNYHSHSLLLLGIWLGLDSERSEVQCVMHSSVTHGCELSNKKEFI